MKSYSSNDVIKMLKAEGWYETDCVGDHHHFKHADKKAKVTVTHPKKRYSNRHFKSNITSNGNQI